MHIPPDGMQPTKTMKAENKRNQAIVLAVVVAANLGYGAYRWATYETYESCLVQAAKSANGVHRAYADLRQICDDRELARMIEKAPGTKPELTDAQVFLSKP